MVREVTIFKVRSEQSQHALQVLEQFAAFKRTQPGCLNAVVNPMVQDPTLPYLDLHSLLTYSEFDNLKSLAECSHALQLHFHLHRLPFQEFIIGQPIYGIYQA